MALSPDEVLHIARLARVAVSDADVQRFAQQLSGILDHFEVLAGAPTDGLEPTAHPLPLANIMRADEVDPSLSHADALANAPAQEDGLFRVRGVLE
jgi:aspartyl-tRNA(Asn)/glutamyl-tRNA(Gln) amidotransferase subunit C